MYDFSHQGPTAPVRVPVKPELCLQPARCSVSVILHLDAAEMTPWNSFNLKA